MQSVRYYCPVLIELEFPTKFFFPEKYSYMEFNENPCRGSRVFSIRRDGRDEIINRFSQSSERHWQPVGFNERSRNLLKTVFIATCW
jgi:hypothetical protein